MIYVLLVYMLLNVYCLGLCWRYISTPKTPKMIIFIVVGSLLLLYQTIKNMINEVLIKMDTATVNPSMLQSLERLFKTSPSILTQLNHN